MQNSTFSDAGGGTRTRTEVTLQGILSPLCLPFHHPGPRPKNLSQHRIHFIGKIAMRLTKTQARQPIARAHDRTQPKR